MNRNDQLTLFYDGACPLCSREVRFMQRLNRDGNVTFCDIAAPGFDPSGTGKSREDLDREIHAQLADGRVIRGMEVFREAYARLGIGWLVAPTGWPVLRPIFDSAYSWFARNRKRIGRLFGGPQCDTTCS